MAVAPLVEGAPSVGAAIIGLGFLFAFLVCLALRQVWVSTFGWLLLTVADALKFRVFHVSVDLGGVFRYANNVVLNALHTLADGSQAGAALFFHAAAYLVAWAVDETVHLAEETLGFARWLTHIHLPRYVRWALTALFPWLLVRRLVADIVKTAVAHLHSFVGAVAHDTRVVVNRLPRALAHELHNDTKRIAALSAAVGALAGSLAWPHPLDIPSPIGLWRGLTRRAARAERRLRRLEALLGVAGFAALMAKTLGLRDWRCLTRGNIGRASRWLCGLDPKLLDLFLVGTLEAAVVSDLCDFTAALTKAAEAASPALLALVDVEDALIGCHGASAAPPLPVPALDLPARPPAVAL